MEPKADILASLPTWVQLAANLGMFLVAVAVSAWGFAKRLTAPNKDGIIPPTLALTDQHFDEGGALHKLGDTFRDLVAAQQRMAAAMEAMLSLSQKRAMQAEIEHEVQLRIKARNNEHAKGV